MIIIFDDDRLSAMLLQEALWTKGLKAIHLAPKPQLIKKIVRQKPELLVLDIIMPRMDGIEVLQFLGQEKSDTPVYLVTGENPVYLKMGVRTAKAFDVNLIGSAFKPYSERTIRNMEKAVLIQRGRNSERETRQLDECTRQETLRLKKMRCSCGW